MSVAFPHSKTVLSASELFKYRLKKDSSLPVRGGQKDFEPDGSWLQNKTLETLIEEKTAILSEPRVEKLKHLVEGVWDDKKKLVNLKRPGKFWIHMGFTDNRRNWLYPEEAMFLLETNNLEIFYNGIPLSIQEAYTLMLGSSVTIEEYQVFAHLRRLGYVVLRFEKERSFTDYECKIKIDQYSKKKKKKSKGDVETSQDEQNTGTIEEGKSCDSSVQEETDNPNTKKKDSNDKTGDGNQDLMTEESTYSAGNKTEMDSHDLSQKRRLSSDELIEDGNDNKRFRPNECSNSPTESSSGSNEISRGFYDTLSWSVCFKKENQDAGGEEQSLMQTELDQEAGDVFPNIANKESITLRCSDSQLFPCEEDIVFDVKDYRAKNPAAPMTKEERKEDLHEMRIQGLNFSFSDWPQKKPEIDAKNWSDFKKKFHKKATDVSSVTPLDHLWNDSVTPLIKPEDATSYENILENLKIVQSANNETLFPEPNETLDEVKISYDVHLPDNKFKKSMPGVPNHRVCVTSADSSPPSLAVIQHLWNQCKDGVPLHWSVVGSGEISFFVFNNSHCLESL